MMKKWFLFFFLCPIALSITAQNTGDSLAQVDANYVMLSEIVVRNKLDVPSFIQRVKNDTTFYKAFRNLRVVGYTALNDIRMFDKDGKTIASLNSKTKQIRTGNCRTMEVLQQSVTGDMFDANGDFNYYTGQMYAGLFFTKGKVCGENNIVGNRGFSTSGLSGMDKRKEQLRMLFFNPGQRITGLPFISNKTEIFDPSMADKYDMSIDYKDYLGQACYVFRMKVKDRKKNGVVINEMTTWFTANTFEIVARNYSLSYSAGVYDFDIEMEVQMTKVGDLLVPAVLKYNGDWKVLFKKREKSVFTATLFDFVAK
jgi:hypothetical protein